jgi:hypothetical protein
MGLPWSNRGILAGEEQSRLVLVNSRLNCLPDLVMLALDHVDVNVVQINPAMADRRWLT